MGRFSVPTPTGDGLLVLETTADGAHAPVHCARVHCEQVTGGQGEAVLAHLDRLAAPSGGRMVVDFARCTSLSLDAARGLARLHDRCERLGGKLVLCALPADAREIFRTLGIDRRLHTARDRREAAKAMSTDRARRRGFLARVFTRDAA